jgi:hypothetical protein
MAAANATRCCGDHGVIFSVRKTSYSSRLFKSWFAIGHLMRGIIAL